MRKCGGLEIKVRETIYRKAEQTKGFETKAAHLMSIDVGCAFLVVIDLPQENIQSLILSPLVSRLS